jgi:hypothetical protein
MTLLRQITRSLSTMFRALATLAVVAACGGAPAAPGSTPDDAHREPFGPESLTVSLRLTDDAARSGSQFSFVAVARNRTTRAVVAQLACPDGGGLVVRVVDAQARTLWTAPIVCRPQFVDGVVQTILPGDSVAMVAGGSVGALGSPTLRLRAVFEAANGRSPAAEVPVPFAAVSVSVAAARVPVDGRVAHAPVP